jgi:tetratricopeptide (TPR) repeat protein
MMNIIRLITFLVFVLISTFANAQSKDLSSVKKHITELLNGRIIIYEVNVEKDQLGNSLGSPKEVLVLDDRIELKFKRQNATVRLSDLLDYSIKGSEYGYVPLGNFSFYMGNKATELASDLNFMQHQLIEKQFGSQLALFEPLAAQYRALKVKPAILEEQRKFIVQANFLNQQKMYGKAIEVYKKAIELDQIAYPGAYSNLALLSAQIKKFNAAIYYMKKYLMLEPAASDARSAQDKIYEWEVQIGK